MADATEPRDATADDGGESTAGWTAKLSRWWRAGSSDGTLPARRQAESALQSAAAAHDSAAEAHRSAAAAHRAAADFADDLDETVFATHHRQAALQSDRDAELEARAADKAWTDALAFRTNEDG